MLLCWVHSLAPQKICRCLTHEHSKLYLTHGCKQTQNNMDVSPCKIPAPAYPFVLAAWFQYLLHQRFCQAHRPQECHGSRDWEHLPWKNVQKVKMLKEFNILQILFSLTLMLNYQCSMQMHFSVKNDMVMMISNCFRFNTYRNLVQYSLNVCNLLIFHIYNI